MSSDIAYVAFNPVLGAKYVGIGPLDRPGQKHRPEVDALLAHPATEIVFMPGFSSRHDLLIAESLAIRYAAIAGTSLNNAGVATSSRLVPLLPTAPGMLSYRALRNTVIVTVPPTAFDGRSAITGKTTGLDLADRLSRKWPTGKAIRLGYPIQRFIAVTKATKNLRPRVVADWQTTPPTQWAADGSIGLVDPCVIDAFGCRGKIFDWAGQHPSNLLTYSADVRAWRDAA